MSTALTISGSIFSIISGTLYIYGYKSSGLVIFIFALLSFSSALVVHLNDQKSNIKERKLLFFSALETINARTRLTVEIVSNFRSICKKYKYTMNDEQADYMGGLLSAIGDVRIIDAELEDANMNKQERKEYISRRRKLLNKIEESTNVINKFLREST